MKKLQEITTDKYLTIEEFGNLLNLDEELDKVSTQPTDDEFKKERTKNKTINTISFLECKYRSSNSKFFKKISKTYLTNKKIKDHFKQLYLKDKVNFATTNYAAFIKYNKKYV